MGRMMGEKQSWGYDDGGKGGSKGRYDSITCRHGDGVNLGHYASWLIV